MDQLSKKTLVMIVLVSSLLGAFLGSTVIAAVYSQNMIREQILAVLPELMTGTDEVSPTQAPVLQLMDYQNTAHVRAVEAVMPSVVGITNKVRYVNPRLGTSELVEQATGTGVIIDADGYIVTNNHVIDRAEEIYVTLGDGQEHKAELVGTDPVTDLAVLKIDQQNLPVVKIGNSDTIVVGEFAIAIGNPLGLKFSQTVTGGFISAKQRAVTIGDFTYHFIQTDAAINDGNSGGALVNLNGEVIGINTAKIKLSGVEGMGFAIPANTVKEITHSLITQGRVIRPYLGVYHGGDVTEALAQRLQLPVSYGAIVEDVVQGGPAQMAGIKADDIVISINGEKVATFGDLRSIIYQQKVGDSVDVIIIRGQEQITVTVKLAEMPSQS